MPVSGVSAVEIAARSEYFEYMIKMQLSSVAFQNTKVAYHVAMPNILAHVYFSLEQAHRKITAPTKIKTDTSVQAAITCAAIAAVRPLRPVDMFRPVDQEEIIYANPMLAMRCATSIDNHPFHDRVFDDKRLVYKTLSGFNLPIADSILNEARRNKGEIFADWEAKLDGSIFRLFRCEVDELTFG